ncbi:MAG: hypothetical protein Q9171_003829 [Xanthocarpia ochracea]
MINAVLVFNNSGQPRLTKFYTQLDTSVQQRLISEIFTLVSNRPASACNFLPLPPLLAPPSTSTTTTDPTHNSDTPTSITYRHYATLYFILISTSTESPLALLDLIQVFVESLDRLFNNVCELDLIFNFEAMHACLAEIVVGGVVVETRVQEIVKGVRDSDRGSVRGKEQKMGPQRDSKRASNAPMSSIKSTPNIRCGATRWLILGQAAITALSPLRTSNMAHAPPKVFPVVRRLRSVSIRRRRSDRVPKFKRLAIHSDVDRRDGDAEFQSPKPGLSPASPEQIPSKYDIHRRSVGDEIRPNDAIDRYFERGRSSKDRLHPSKFNERGAITTPKFEYLFIRRRIKIENPDHQTPNLPAHRADATSSQHSIAASTGQDYAKQMPIPVGGILRKVEYERPEWRQHQQQRAFTTSAQRPAPSPTACSTPEPISIDQFHRLADQYIDNLVSKLEELQEERRDVDCEYSAGVLNLDFPPAGTYVFNKQPPNKQIWLSSPISGPKRYDYVLIPSSSPETSETSTGGDGAARSGVGSEGQEKKADWVYLRDGSTLSELLKEELDIDMEDV